MQTKVQLTPRQVASRKNGALGGIARAARHSKKKIAEWSAKGGNVTQETYGSDLKRHIGEMRRHVGRARKPVAECNIGKRKTAPLKKVINVETTTGRKRAA